MLGNEHMLCYLPRTVGNFGVVYRILPSPSLPLYFLICMYFLYVQYYGSVSEAISSSKVEGQRIIIHPGVYNENIVLDRPVTLIGASRLLWQIALHG